MEPDHDDRQRAVRLAQDATGVGSTTVSFARAVRRLDRPSSSYWLVVLGAQEQPEAVAAVDLDRGVVMSWASLSGTGPHVGIGADEAIELSELGESATAQLVWRPSQATRSPLYPVWEVARGDQIVYVDHDRQVRTDLGSTTA